MKSQRRTSGSGRQKGIQKARYYENSRDDIRSSKKFVYSLRYAREARAYRIYVFEGLNAHKMIIRLTECS